MHGFIEQKPHLLSLAKAERETIVVHEYSVT